MRLIDADKLKAKVRAQEWKRDPTIMLALNWIYMLIDNSPTIDAVPVVRGEWIEHEDEMECPQCGYFWNYCDNDTERFNCCPNCGAKMESEGSA